MKNIKTALCLILVLTLLGGVTSGMIWDAEDGGEQTLLEAPETSDPSDAEDYVTPVPAEDIEPVETSSAEEEALPDTGEDMEPEASDFSDVTPPSTIADVTALAAEAAAVGTPGDLQDAIDAALTDGTLCEIEISASFALNGEINIPAGTNIALSSSGGTRTITSASGYRHFNVTGAAFKLSDVVLDGGCAQADVEDGIVTAYSGGVAANGAYVALTLTDNAVIQNCYAINGGAININAGTLYMDGYSKLLGNTAATDGGGIWAASMESVSLKGGVTIRGNAAVGTIRPVGQSSSGGGIYLYNCKVFLISNGTVDGNNSASMGGGIYVTGIGSSPIDMTVTDSEIINNTAKGLLNPLGGSATAGGGGIYFHSPGTLTLSGNSSVSMNRTDGTGNNNTGGGVFFSSGDFSGGTGLFTIKDSALVEKNTAAIGGGVYLSSSSHGLMQGGTITGNTVSLQGGGVCASASVFTMERGDIVGNTADSYGGGVSLINSTMDMTGGEISGNTAVGAYAGGVIVYGSTFTMKGGEITGNAANTNGGGVYATGSTSAVTMSGGTIKLNEVNGNGGGVFVNANARFSMAGGTIFDNEAVGNGGGVYMNNTSLTMSGGDIIGNTATVNGGGIYVTGTVSVSYMFGGTIGSEAAPNRAVDGAGVYVNTSAVFYMEAVADGTSGTICRNEASGSGGGVYVYTSSGTVAYGRFVLFAGVVTGNGAAANGGGVYVSQYSEASIATDYDNDSTDEAEISENNAQQGGGVYVAGEFTIEGEYVTVDENKADANGGGVYVTDGGKLNMNEGTLRVNTADKGNGGGIYGTRDAVLEVGTWNLASVCGITDNKAENGEGGGIYTATADYISGDGASAYGNLKVGEYATFSGNKALKFYDPLNASAGAAYVNYWVTIDNTTYSAAVDPTVVSRLVSVNNFDINAQTLTVVFHTGDGEYQVDGATADIDDQTVALDDYVANPEDVPDSRMYLKNYEFTQWQLTGGAVWDFDMDVANLTADEADGDTDDVIHLYAQWEKIEGSITINKFRDDGITPLGGVTFKLTDKDGILLETLTTDDSGTVEFKGDMNDASPAGYVISADGSPYLVTETQTAPGHSLLADSIKVNIPESVTLDVGETPVSDSYNESQTITDLVENKVTYFYYDPVYNVTNQASFYLPAAGSGSLQGQYFLLIGLVCFLAAGGIGLYSSKRRGARKA